MSTLYRVHSASFGHLGSRPRPGVVFPRDYSLSSLFSLSFFSFLLSFSSSFSSLPTNTALYSAYLTRGRSASPKINTAFLLRLEFAAVSSLLSPPPPSLILLGILSF